MSKPSSDSGNKPVDQAISKTKQSGVLAGIENPRRAAYAAFAVCYVFAPPVVFVITKPGGIAQTAVELSWKTLLPHAASVPKDRIIPALATIYATFTFGITGALSVTGLAMGRKEDIDVQHPRAGLEQLRGLPLRLKSAHDHLQEAFPMWAVAAALAQVLAPKNQQIINILGLAMLSKVAVHYPAYVLNIAPVRSLGHLAATASATAVLYALATGAC